MMDMNFLEMFGTVVGLVYLWLEYRASIYLWIAGIIMPAIYIFVYYKAGLYADFGINIYYLIAAVYGWFSGCGDEEKEKAGSLPTWEKMINCNNFLSSILRVDIISLFSLYLSFHFSALPGYLSSTPTVTCRGWIVSLRH